MIFFFGGGLALLDGYSGDRIGSISKRINLLPKSLKKKKKTTINKLRLKFNNGNKQYSKQLNKRIDNPLSNRISSIEYRLV